MVWLDRSQTSDASKILPDLLVDCRRSWFRPWVSFCNHRRWIRTYSTSIESWTKMSRLALSSQLSSCSTGFYPLRTIGLWIQMKRPLLFIGLAEDTMCGSEITEETWTRPFPNQPATQRHTSTVSKNLVPTTFLLKSTWCWESQVFQSWLSWDTLRAVPKWCTPSPKIKTTLLTE